MRTQANTRKLIDKSEYDYRTILISSRDRVGAPASSPIDCKINYNFNFDGVEKLAMKKFTWVASQTPLETSFMAFIRCDALTKWDPKHYQNSSQLGPSILDSIPMSAKQYLPTYPPAAASNYFYEPINLNWHEFSNDNTIGVIDFKLIGIQGELWKIDPAITFSGEWDMEILLAFRPDSQKRHDYQLLN